MSLKLGTLDFYQALAQVLNADEEWASVGRSINYSIVFGHDEAVRRDFFIRFSNGRVEEVREAEAQDHDVAAVVVTGPTEVWRAVFTKKRTPMNAISRGELSFKGKLTVLLKNMKAFNYVLDAMGALDVADIS
ncbi:SCP2 sterol-binding domain-containing protein [Mycobacterium sp. NPDC003449]